MDERSSLGTVSKSGCVFRNARARNTHVDATSNHSCAAQVTKDTHRDVQRVEKVASIHKNAKLHDAKAESFFRFVQVFTAIVASFSHGANDVANAMGPFSAAYVAYKKGKVVPKHEMDPDTMMWILALGGAGIVVGLATYGYKIMNAMGVKMIAITPSRGYCIELGAALVVIYGTAQGWPLSTTLDAEMKRAGMTRGGKRERNSKLQSLISRPFSTRFG